MSNEAGLRCLCFSFPLNLIISFIFLYVLSKKRKRKIAIMKKQPYTPSAIPLVQLKTNCAIPLMQLKTKQNECMFYFSDALQGFRSYQMPAAQEIYITV